MTETIKIYVNEIPDHLMGIADWDEGAYEAIPAGKLIKIADENWAQPWEDDPEKWGSSFEIEVDEDGYMTAECARETAKCLIGMAWKNRWIETYP